MVFWYLQIYLLVVLYANPLPWITVQQKRPNILLIIADDMGWNDIGFHNPNIFTPNLDNLAHGGIILNQSYMQSMCSPSRSAFLTGYYPFRSGMNHGVLRGMDPQGLPTRFKLLPQKLKELGYSNHIIGKWHLGYCNEKYLPQNRGFDSFFGTYLGALDYYTHCAPTRPYANCLFNESRLVEDEQGINLNDLIVMQTKHVLENHDKINPLFLYLPFTAPHSPLQAQEKYIKMYEGIENEPRRIYSAMVTALDDSIGSILNLLKEKGFYENSIIVFSSDNGGQVKAGGNNYPLRGGKCTFYEGGMRVPAFVHSPLLQHKGYVYNGIIHAVDWFSTLQHLAGGNSGPDVDGINVWEALITNSRSPRQEFIYNIDTYFKVKGAIRVGDFKLIFGHAGLPNERVSEDNVTGEYANGATDVIDTTDTLNSPEFRLYNIADDPYENEDLADKMPLKVIELAQRIDSYLDESVQPLIHFPPVIYPYSPIDICKPGWCDAIEDAVKFRPISKQINS